MASKQNRNGHARRTRTDRLDEGGDSPSTKTSAPGAVAELIRTGAQVIKEVREVVGQRAAGEATDLTRKLRSEGTRLLDRQKGVAAEGIGHVSSAIRQAAERLHMGQAEGLSQYVESAAEKADRASRYLSERDLAAIGQDAQRLARRRPAWFLGGMLVTGLVLGRFARAVRESGQPQARPAGGPEGDDDGRRTRRRRRAD